MASRLRSGVVSSPAGGTTIADRNARRRQLVEGHDAPDKAGCPLPRFDAFNGARLAERIAVIVKQRDRAQKKGGSSVSGDSLEIPMLRHAIGLMATIKPSMVMRPNDPFGMAQEVAAEVEKLRMQLAVCGVLAGCNTRESLAQHRPMDPDYDCDAVRCVIGAVEREIDLRERLETAEAKLADIGKLAGSRS